MKAYNSTDVGVTFHPSYPLCIFSAIYMGVPILYLHCITIGVSACTQETGGQNSKLPGSQNAFGCLVGDSKTVRVDGYVI